MEVLLIVSIFLFVIMILYKWLTRNIEFEIKVNIKNGFKFLLGWIIFGFFTRLDYSEAWGCNVGFEPVFETRNVLFSSISFGVIFLAFTTQNIKIRKFLCAVELIFWIAKLITCKGGYVVGFGGVPSITIVFYDLIAALARLFILSQVFLSTKPNFIKIGIMALVILSLKILIFATPLI